MQWVPDHHEGRLGQVAQKLVPALKKLHSFPPGASLIPDYAKKPYNWIGEFETTMCTIGFSGDSNVRLAQVQEYAKAARTDPADTLLLFRSQFPSRYGQPPWNTERGTRKDDWRTC
jgi:hypothetical protein